MRGDARRVCSLLPDSPRAKEAGEHVNLHFESTQFGFQLLKLNLHVKTTREVAEPVCQ